MDDFTRRRLGPEDPTGSPCVLCGVGGGVGRWQLCDRCRREQQRRVDQAEARKRGRTRMRDNRGRLKYRPSPGTCNSVERGAAVASRKATRAKRVARVRVQGKVR